MITFVGFYFCCFELGRLATTRRRGCVTERPPRLRPRTPSVAVLGLVGPFIGGGVPRASVFHQHAYF